MEQNTTRDEVIASCMTTFTVSSVPEVFGAAYDWWFIPRSPDTRAQAKEAVTHAFAAYEADGRAPDWLYAVHAKRMAKKPQQSNELATLTEAITCVLEKNPGLVYSLGISEQDWVRTIPLLVTLVFAEVYGELPQNVSGTPDHYAFGVTDPRWDNILNTKVAGGPTGLQILKEQLSVHNKKL